MEKIKVLIIDDEILAIDFLKNLIDWEKRGFQVVGEALNPYDGLHLFKEYNPQIVITDICMPGINGLSLCEEMKKINPHVKMILLTAYKNFDYAKEAIKVGVVEYVVKHEITGEKLLQTLANIEEEILEENNSLEQERQEKLRSLMLGMLSSDHEKQKLRAEYDNEKKGFLLFLFDDMSGDPVCSHGKKGFPAISELKHVADFEAGPNRYVVLTECRRTQTFSNAAYLAKMAGLIFQWITGRKLQRESCIINKSPKKIDKLEELYTRSVTLKKYIELLELPGRIHAFGHEETLLLSRKGCYTQLQESFQDIHDGMEDGEIHKVEESLKKLYLVDLRDRGTLQDVHFVNQAVRDILIRMQKKKLVTEEWDEGYLEAELARCRSLREMYSFFQSKYQQLLRSNNELYAESSAKVRESITYIHENYQRCIGLPDIAKAVGVSESYLIKAFKKDMQCTVHDYLTDVRIHVAKECLLRKDMKIYEVARQTGFSTSQYFSIVFLKKTGMTPKQYKQLKESGDKK